MLPYKAECPQLDGSSDPAHPFGNGGRKDVGILGVNREMRIDIMITNCHLLATKGEDVKTRAK